MSITAVIKKKFDNFNLDISFTADNTHVGLLGASGCGKSMTLKCIAGIEKPDSGFIEINGHTVFDSEHHINIRPQDRRCGFLFQNYALFPNMTVKQNISIVLHGFSKTERTDRTENILKRFNLEQIASLKPYQLSGGQQQRAALARIMVLDPEIIMLDEPFSALDFYIKQQIESQVIELLSGFKGTLLFVSHNRDEVYRICDSLRIISNGAVCRSGSCTDIFADPQNVASALLTGCKNIAECCRTGSRTLFVKDWNISLSTNKDISDTVTHIGIRAHYIRPALDGETRNVFEFNVKDFRNSPFSVSEYITVPGAVHPIDREISVDTGNVMQHPAYELAKIQRLCLPAESLLLLSD